jgi:peptide deformylase
LATQESPEISAGNSCNSAVQDFGKGQGEQRKEEGCLSIPEFSEVVTRPYKIIVRGQDIYGNEIQIEAEDILARCLSHEIDHLKGIMFIDHLSALKRSLIKNKIKRLAKSGKW